MFTVSAAFARYGNAANAPAANAPPAAFKKSLRRWRRGNDGLRPFFIVTSLTPKALALFGAMRGYSFAKRL
jgi:hypothetical protein